MTGESKLIEWMWQLQYVYFLYYKYWRTTECRLYRVYCISCIVVILIFFFLEISYTISIDAGKKYKRGHLIVVEEGKEVRKSEVTKQITIPAGINITSSVQIIFPVSKSIYNIYTKHLAMLKTYHNLVLEIYA